MRPIRKYHAIAVCSLVLLLSWMLNRGELEPTPAIGAEVQNEELFIPPDAAGFLSIAFAQIWDSPQFKEVRQVLEQLKADESFRQSVGLRFNEIERVTMILPYIPDLQEEPSVAFLITTKRALNKAKIIDAMDAFSPADHPRDGIPAEFPRPAVPTPPVQIKEAKDHQLLGLPVDWNGVKNGGGLEEPKKEQQERDLTSSVYYGSSRTLILFLSEHHVMFMPESDRNAGVAHYLALALRKSKSGVLVPAINLLTSGKHQVVGCLDLTRLKKSLAKAIPDDMPGVGLLEAERLTMTIDLGAKLQLGLSFESRNPRAAQPVETAAKSIIEQAQKKIPEIIKSMKTIQAQLEQVEASLQRMQVKTESNKVMVAMSLETDKLLSGVLEQALLRIRESAFRSTIMNHFKQLGIAVHAFHDTMGYLPFPGFDPKGMIATKFDDTKLSWRVALLPYLEEGALFQQFKLDEPWDSDHNKKLIPLMPKVYSAKKEINLKEGQTLVQMFRGPQGLQPRGAFNGVTDGLSNTILFAEAAEGVIWTKPDDIPFDVSKPIPKLGGNFGGDFVVCMGDGSVRWVRRSRVSDETSKLLIQPADGTPIPNDW